MPDGTAMTIELKVKKAWVETPTPESNMWCAQTIKPITLMATKEPTMPR